MAHESEGASGCVLMAVPSLGRLVCGMHTRLGFMQGADFGIFGSVVKNIWMALSLLWGMWAKPNQVYEAVRKRPGKTARRFNRGMLAGCKYIVRSYDSTYGGLQCWASSAVSFLH